MRTALDVPSEVLDPSEQSFVAKIKDHGWFRTEVFGEAEKPGFSFTTGFWASAGQPEIIMFGMKGEIVHDVFWDMFQDVKTSGSIPIGRRTDRVFDNLPAYTFLVAKRFYADHLGWSRWFYGGDEFPCVQIVWPDRAGVFPWEAGFDQSFAGDQADLTEHGWQAALAD